MPKISEKEIQFQGAPLTLYYSNDLVALPIRGEITLFYPMTYPCHRYFSWVINTFRGTIGYHHREGDITIFMDEGKKPHHILLSHAEEDRRRIADVQQEYNLKNPEGLVKLLAQNRKAGLLDFCLPEPARSQIRQIVKSYFGTLIALKDNGIDTANILMEDPQCVPVVYELVRLYKFSATWCSVSQSGKYLPPKQAYQPNTPKLMGRGDPHIREIE